MSSIAPAPQREPLTVQFSARTDVGRVRANNEDNFLVDRRLRLYVVCDGLGGHHGGDIASATAVNLVREVVLSRRDALEHYELHRDADTAIIDMLEDAAAAANARVYERGSRRGDERRMATTLSLLLLAGARAFIAHVGDTRIYRWRDGLMLQLTEDHSLITEMRREVHMSREQIESLDGRLKNQITRAVGVSADVEVDVFSVDVEIGDRFLLCSDGLHGVVPEEQLARLVSHPELVETASRLVDAANGLGGKDNITAIVVELSAPMVPAANRRVWPIFEVARTTSLFQGLADLELTTVLEQVQVLSLKAEEALVRGSSTLLGLYLVLEGELQVVRRAEVVATLGRADFFAEDAILIERSSGATVTATAAGAVVAVIERTRFEELQRTRPDVALKLSLAVGRSLARKVDGYVREGGVMQFRYKDPGAMTRPLPRPAKNPRVLADTEPEIGASFRDIPTSAAAVLRRPRSDKRRAALGATQPAIPVLRGRALGPPDDDAQRSAEEATSDDGEAESPERGE